jgi:hypothetical protein
MNRMPGGGDPEELQSYAEKPHVLQRIRSIFPRIIKVVHIEPPTQK